MIGLTKAKTMIRNAWVAAAVSGLITLILSIITANDTQKGINLDAPSFVDIALIFCLAFGIYKKSRICAILMLAYFIISKLISFIGSPQYGLTSLPVILIFVYFYIYGIIGTFTYHKLKRQQQPI